MNNDHFKNLKGKGIHLTIGCSLLILVLIIFVHSIAISNTRTFNETSYMAKGLNKTSNSTCNSETNTKSPAINTDLNKLIDKTSSEKDINKKPSTPLSSKIAYLTFDDGPSRTVTPRILDILNKYRINATFFVIGQHAENNKDLIKREWSEGNMIGNHTYDHNVGFLWKRPINLINELTQCDSILKSIIPGYNKKLCRFPGGSKNWPHIFKAAVTKDGYKYVDWNCLTRDAEVPNISVNTQLNYIKYFSSKRNNLIILMHDDSAESTTADALPKIIDYLEAKNYVFKTLS